MYRRCDGLGEAYSGEGDISIGFLDFYRVLSIQGEAWVYNPE